MRITIKMLAGWCIATVLFILLALNSNSHVTESHLADWITDEVASQAAADLLAEDRVRLKYLVDQLAASPAVSYAAILDADNGVVVSAGQHVDGDIKRLKPVLIDRALAGYAQINLVPTQVQGPSYWWFLLPLIILMITPLIASNQVVLQGARPIKGTTYQLKVQLGSRLDTPINQVELVQRIDAIFELVAKLYPLRPEGHGLTFTNTKEDLYQCLCCAVVVRNALAYSLQTEQLDQIRIVLAPASLQTKGKHPITLAGFMPQLQSDRQWQLVDIGESQVATLADEQLEDMLERQAMMIAKQIA